MKKIKYLELPYSSRTYGRFVILCLLFIALEVFRVEYVTTSELLGTSITRLSLSSFDYVLDMFYAAAIFAFAASPIARIKYGGWFVIILSFIKVFVKTPAFIQFDIYASIFCLLIIMYKCIDEYLKEDYYGIFKSR